MPDQSEADSGASRPDPAEDITENDDVTPTDSDSDLDERDSSQDDGDGDGDSADGNEPDDNDDDSDDDEPNDSDDEPDSDDESNDSEDDDNEPDSDDESDDNDDDESDSGDDESNSGDEPNNSDDQPNDSEDDSDDNDNDSAATDSPAKNTSASKGKQTSRKEPKEDVDAKRTDNNGGFADLGLNDRLLAALNELGYEEPTPIQREAIPLVLEGKDLVGQAATGTGKTAAFALPIIDRISPDDAPIPQALIVVPTRELAVQVSEALFKYGQGSGVRVIPVFGGQPISRQLKALRRGVHVVVATPGRAIDHIKRGSLELSAIQTVVLDEADEMLDMGFTEDIESILEATPSSRQTVLFSATMPPRIKRIAETYQRKPVTVKIGVSSDQRANPQIRQTVYMVPRNHKASALGRILDIESPTATIVFCRTRLEVDELTVTMNGRGYRAEALHGGMDQKQRDRVMARLRDGTAELLIATDVAARGIDVDSLTHVVNYDVPSAPESYVHRIGRVGRAGREGVAITIAEPRQRRLLRNIERLTKQEIALEKVPSVADLRTRQIEMTSTAVSDALAADDLDDYEAVLDSLDAEHDHRDIALAAIKIVHEARGATIDESEIPDASEWNDNKRKGRKDRDRDDWGRNDKRDKKGGKGRDRGPRRNNGDTGYLHFNLGRKVGLRPGDLVGAVANEAGLSGSEIGPIRIGDHFAVVGIPEDAVDKALKIMKSTTIRGKRAKVRRWEERE